MRSAKLQEWLERAGRRKRAATYRLVHESLDARNVVATWDTVELAQEDDAGASTVLTAAQDHCDDIEQSAAYRVEAVDAADHVIATVPLRLKPVLSEDTRPNALRAHEANGPELLVHFMNSDIAKTKIVIGAMGAIIAGFEKTLTQLLRSNEQLSRQNQDLTAALQAARVSHGDDRELSEEERLEAAAKANAWNRIGEVLPDIVQTGLLVMRARNGADG